MTNVCPIDSDTRHVTYLYDGESRPYAGVYASGEATPVAFGIATTDRGDVRELTDISGTPFAFYAYDAYGMPLAADGTATASVDATLAATIAGANVLRYAGYCFDEHSGMYYLSQRYYDPTTCQFITKDTAKADGEESAYQYCGGDPVGKVDPSGERPIVIWRWRYSASFSGLSPLLRFAIGGLAKGAVKLVRGLSSAAKIGLAKALETAMNRALRRAQGTSYTATERTKGYAAYLVHGLYTRPSPIPGVRESIMYWAKAFRAPLKATDSRGKPLTYNVYFSFTTCLGTNNFQKLK